jgi:hypothetical protein
MALLPPKRGAAAQSDPNRYHAAAHPGSGKNRGQAAASVPPLATPEPFESRFLRGFTEILPADIETHFRLQ